MFHDDLKGRLYDKNGIFHEDETAGLWTNEYFTFNSLNF